MIYRCIGQRERQSRCATIARLPKMNQIHLIDFSVPGDSNQARFYLVSLAAPLRGKPIKILAPRIHYKQENL